MPATLQLSANVHTLIFPFQPPFSHSESRTAYPSVKSFHSNWFICPYPHGHIQSFQSCKETMALQRTNCFVTLPKAFCTTMIMPSYFTKLVINYKSATARKIKLKKIEYTSDITKSKPSVQMTGLVFFVF